MGAMLHALTGGFAQGMMHRLRGPRFISPPRDAAERGLQFRRDGFVAGGPLLERAEVECLRAEFDRIFAGRNVPGSTIFHKRFADGAGGEYFTVYDLHRLSAPFRALVTHPRLARMLAEITGSDRMRVLLDQIQYKPPRNGGWNGWHRDMPSFPFIRPYTALTAWIALDDATEQNGCLRMVPGSHLWGDASDLAGDDWGLPSPPKVYHGHEVREVSRPMRAGHVHFHHELVWHCSPPNPTPEQRRAFAILFVDADARYRAGGKTEYPELSHGDPMDAVAPLVVAAGEARSRI